VAIEDFKAYNFNQVSFRKGDIMLVEKYEYGKGDFLYAEFGHRSGLIPEGSVEIMNIQKGNAILSIYCLP